MKNRNTILIVDDEPTALDVLGGLLSQEDCNLVFASNGYEALEKVERAEPDVILLDVMMPELDGFQICRQLKDDERYQHIPIILVTALNSKDDMNRGYEAGADDFLHKPVNSPELRLRVRSMLRIKNQYDNLEAALHLREDLAHLIMHDMRSPLTAIIGICELSLMKISLGKQDTEDDIKRIHAQARRLNSFLNDMLIVAKMEAGELLLNRVSVDINPFIEEVVQSHQVIAESKKINLTSNLPLTSRELLLDTNLFQRVLDNLLANALKFSPPDSTVTVSVEYPGEQNGPAAPTDSVCIKIEDQGPGIPEKDRLRIFDKFEIVSMKESSAVQFGLGLAFCKMVTEAHGGRIFVEPNLPQGSVFTVEI